MSEEKEQESSVINGKTPFIAFIRSNKERLQVSYASMNPVLIGIPRVGGEHCVIYAGGYEISLEGRGIDELCDLLLECKIKKVVQIEQDKIAHTKTPIITKMEWQSVYED